MSGNDEPEEFGEAPEHWGRDVGSEELPPDLEELSRIREQVLARVAEESEGEDPVEKSPEVPARLVYQCLQSNELGDGTLYATLYRGRFVYDKSAGEWLVWAGHHWERDLMGRSLAAVAGVADLYLREALAVKDRADELREKGQDKAAASLDGKIKSLFKRVSRLRAEGGRKNCISFAHTLPVGALAIRGDELDRNPWLLACANGVIDLRTGKFREGRPEDYLLKAAEVPWEGIDAPAAVFEKALLEMMDGDEEMVAYLRRVFGYGITGLNVEHVLPVLWGQGRNGKSVLVEALSWVLGDLAGPIQSEMLLDQGRSRSSSGPSPDIMALRGMRLVFGSETDDGRKISPSRVKWLSGGDTLVGRRPHDKYETAFDATHLLILLTNHKPHAPADDFAFWERLALVPFRLSFVARDPSGPNERPADKTLPDRIRKEGPGILAWLVRGCLEWQAMGGMHPPDLVQEATAEYRRDEDLIADFLDECCMVDDKEARTRATELYEAFCGWFETAIGAKVPKQKRFGKLLGSRFNKEKIGGLYYYLGVELRSPALDGPGR